MPSPSKVPHVEGLPSREGGIFKLAFRGLEVFLFFSRNGCVVQNYKRLPVVQPANTDDADADARLKQAEVTRGIFVF